MRIVFSETFHNSDYSPDAFDNAAEPGRMLRVIEALRDEGRYATEVPGPATRGDVLLGHTEPYVASVERRPVLYGMACMAVGGAILASELAMRGEASFACVRPPGHHASRASAWGHCTFSNVALSLLRLRESCRIRSALVLDFDQHTGDGTIDVLREWRDAIVFNPYGNDAAEYLRCIEERLATAPQVDILAVSAGFDGYLLDLGRKLATADYFTIGRLLQAYAIRLGHQRRFAVLEGGYYLPDLGKNALAFCRGFE